MTYHVLMGTLNLTNSVTPQVFKKVTVLGVNFVLLGQFG